MSPKATLLIADSIFRGFDGENFRHRDFKNFYKLGASSLRKYLFANKFGQKISFFESWRNEIYSFVYPGITAYQLGSELRHEFLPPPSQIRLVILHVGTNNASTSRSTQEMHHAKADIKFCIDTVQELYHRAHIVIRYDLYHTGSGCNTNIPRIKKPTSWPLLYDGMSVPQYNGTSVRLRN